jgi:hypothetical protein
VIQFYLFTLVPLSVLLPVITGFVFSKRLTQSAKLIWIYAWVSGIFNLLGIVLAKNGLNNMPLFHIYTPIEFSLCMLFFASVFEPRWALVLTYILIPLFILFCIINGWLLQSIWKFNTNTRPVEALFLVIVCLYYLYNSLQIKSGALKTESIGIWFCLGILFYFSGSIFLFIFKEEIKNQISARKLGWALHASLVLLMNILFTLGFTRYRSTT